MGRVYYPYEMWEDYKNGMYNECKDGREERVKQAAKILGTSDICTKAMQKVVSEWNICTEYNLSNCEVNRKAWLGQAACSCYGNIHEDETREAWGIMTEQQRVQANRIAQAIIDKWDEQNGKRENAQISMFDEWEGIA